MMSALNVQRQPISMPSHPTPSPARLVDRFGRHIHYARLSVTDRCDFRCVYCMAEEMEFLPRKEILSLEELLDVGTALVNAGIDKIRLTGGEPLVRNDIMWLVERLGALPGLRELTLTTNGSRLAEYAGPLRAAGVRRINISLDSLQADKFKQIARTGKLASVLEGIDAAIDAGFEQIKLNSVILKHRNDDEVPALVEFALNKGLDISFIEEMPLGEIVEHDRKLAFYSSDEVRGEIERHFTLESSDKKTNGPSRYRQIAGSNTHIGFISPHSNNFCEQCNRVRVTVEGRLLLCLGNEHSVDFRALLRDESLTDQQLLKAFKASLDIKPEKHEFNLDQPVEIVRFMNMTGG